jgi:hypothetical protein
MKQAERTHIAETSAYFSGHRRTGKQMKNAALLARKFLMACA